MMPRFVLKSVTPHRHQGLKIIAVALMASFLLVTFTIADSLTYQAFVSDTDNFVLRTQLAPPDESIFASQDPLLAELNQTGYSDGAEVIYLDMMEEMTYSASVNLSRNILVVGLSSLSTIPELENTTGIGIEQKTAQLFGLSKGENITLHTENASVTITIEVILNLTSWIATQTASALATWSFPPSYIPLFTSVSNARNITHALPLAYRNSDITDWVTVTVNITKASAARTLNHLSSYLESAVIQVYDVLAKYGTAKLGYTPIDRMDRFIVDYSQIEREVAIIVYPTIVVSIIYLTFMLRVGIERQKRRFAILLSRGVSWFQIRLANLVNDILVGILGGALSIPLAIIISVPLLPAESSIIIGALTDVSELMPLITGEILIGILLIALPATLVHRTFKDVHSPVQLARITEDDQYESHWKMMVVFLILALVMFYEMLSNFSFIQWLILNAGNSPTMIPVARLLMWLELGLAVVVPVLVVVSVARFAPWWHTRLWESVARITRFKGVGSSLVAKALSLRPRRSYYLAVLFLSSIFLATFIGTYQATQDQVTTVDAHLQIGSDMQIYLYKADGDIITSFLNFIAEQQGVQEISNCSAVYAELLNTDGYYRQGMMYIVDDTYRALSSLVEDEKALMNKTSDGVLVSASLVDEFAETTALSTVVPRATVNVTVSGSISFAPGFHEEIDDFQTSYLRIVTSKSYLNSLGFSPETTDAYIFVNTLGDVIQLSDTVSQWLRSVSSVGESLSYSVKTQVSAIQNVDVQTRFAFINSSAGYLVIAGLAAVIMNVMITLDEKRYQLQVINARGTTRRQIVIGLSMYYLSLAVPMVFLGAVLSLLYVNAVMFAPLMLTHELSTSGQFQMPKGYEVVIPQSVVIASIAIVVASLVAIYVLVNRYLQKKHSQMEED